MTPSELDLVVARTRHERLRELTSDANPDVWQRDRYRERVAALASGAPGDPGDPPIATIPLDESTRLLRLVHSCPDRTAETECGCEGLAKCGLGLGRGDGLVTIRECLECRAGAT